MECLNMSKPDELFSSIIVFLRALVLADFSEKQKKEGFAGDVSTMMGVQIPATSPRYHDLDNLRSF